LAGVSSRSLIFQKYLYCLSAILSTA